MSAEDRFATLKSEFGELVGLVHGRMKGAEKDEAMRAFKEGETKILVATTVIEVGVDVPDATIMVIEHAERFGLAQLHQLRGRVGRGSKPSSCVLLYKDPLGETAKKRLSVMRETEDGFLISEEDLKLRGEGELLGTKQSGTPGFQVARIEFHARSAGGRPRRRAAHPVTRPRPADRARPGAARAALSVRARRGGQAAEGGVSGATLHLNLRFATFSTVGLASPTSIGAPSLVTTLRLYSGATRPAETISLAPSSIDMSSMTISER